MGAVHDFFDQLAPMIGAYYDVGIACDFALDKIAEVQKQHNLSDESTLSYGEGEPKGTPEEVAANAQHATTIGATKARMARGGIDRQQTASAVLVFVYHLWDEIYRHAIAREKGIEPRDLKVDIFGDVRLLRNAIIHNKGIADENVAKCRTFTRFKPGDQLLIGGNDLSEIYNAIRDELRPYA
jgi:hypothetical protein